ncbi:MAG: Autoinducer 2 sensor kinase/phosphatase LuxQ [Pseudomonas sp.]|nr:MAG: Autoinducer 2 sensor kinase/phosphatase LuxQ [Pseudomonas sp.]
MKRKAAACVAAFCVWHLPAGGAALDLTRQEQDWIAEHPVVRIAVDPDWKPIEYVENGQYKGITAEYIKQIAQRTGLRFEIVHDAGWGTVTQRLQRKEVDVLPAALQAFTTPAVAGLVNFTHNYFVGITVVVTREQGTAIYDLSKLNGHTVSLKGGGAYQDRIRALYPGITILPSRTPDEELMAVVEGRADAAVGSAAALLPYLKRKYDGVLHEAGVIGSLPMELAMGVRSDLPVLHGILNKALDSFTAKETDQMVEYWFEKADYGKPSLLVLLRYYASQLALTALSLLLIAGFALHARRERRRGVQSEKEKTMFLAVLSHEIRSPMNAILASMELLQRSQLPSEPKHLLQVASNGAEHLLRLLDDVLDISKLEAGRLQLDIAPMDIMELSRTVTDLLGFKAQEKGITLTLQENGSITRRLMLDRLRVGQVLHNLVANAVKFTSQGGVTVSLRYEAGALWVSIADTGIGMDMTARQRLFEPYSQASAATARKFGGTGLGLPICRQLVELMKGTIEIDSELGKGTTITVQLPCALHSSLAGEAPPAITPLQDLRFSHAHVLQVLLVEDTLANQAVLKAQLDALGCGHTLAVDGKQALRALAQARYDIVLLDCDLPDITGYEVARRWREEEVAQGKTPTPILALSASTDTGHTAACFEAGMDGVLKKPIKLGKLRDALQLWSDVSLVQAADEAPVADGVSPAIIVQALEEDLHALGVARQAGDTDAAAHYAHRLVGACEVLGASQVATLARSLEAQFRQGEVGNGQTLDALRVQFSRWVSAGVSINPDK